MQTRLAPSRHRSAVDRLSDLAGGDQALADWAGVDRSTVAHWRRPSPAQGGGKNGRDGRIPDKYHAAILAAARRRGLALDPGALVNL